MTLVPDTVAMEVNAENLGAVGVLSSDCFVAIAGTGICPPGKGLRIAYLSFVVRHNFMQAARSPRDYIYFGSQVHLRLC